MRLRCKRNIDGEPLIMQHEFPQCRLSWNPDDGIFYVDKPSAEFEGEWETFQVHKYWKNATRATKRLMSAE